MIRRNENKTERHSLLGILQTSCEGAERCELLGDTILSLASVGVRALERMDHGAITWFKSSFVFVLVVPQRKEPSPLPNVQFFPINSLQRAYHLKGSVRWRGCSFPHLEPVFDRSARLAGGCVGCVTGSVLPERIPSTKDLEGTYRATTG